jgi:hypothetical protein
MRIIAAAAIAVAALGLSACGNTVAGNAVQGNPGSPLQGSNPASQTFNLDNSKGTMLNLDYPNPDCQASASQPESVAGKCLKSLTGATFTLHGVVDFAVNPGTGNTYLTISRNGINGHLTAVCPDNVSGCSSLQQGERVYVVTQLQSGATTPSGQPGLPSQVVQSITAQ